MSIALSDIKGKSGLPAGVLRKLASLGVESSRDFATLDLQQFARIPGIGAVAIARVISIASEFGHALHYEPEIRPVTRRRRTAAPFHSDAIWREGDSVLNWRFGGTQVIVELHALDRIARGRVARVEDAPLRAFERHRAMIESYVSQHGRNARSVRFTAEAASQMIRSARRPQRSRRSGRG